MSLLGLVRHMAEVERGWFRRRFAGLDVLKRYQADADPDADFNGAVSSASMPSMSAVSNALVSRSTRCRSARPSSRAPG